MKTLKFSSEKERALHPQARLINTYLLKQVFNNTLTEKELVALEFGHISDITGLSNNEKERLFICLLLSDGQVLSSDEAINLARETFRLSSYGILNCAALAEKKDIVLSCPFGKFVQVYRKLALASYLRLSYLVMRGSLYCLLSHLVLRKMWIRL